MNDANAPQKASDRALTWTYDASAVEWSGKTNVGPVPGLDEPCHNILIQILCSLSALTNLNSCPNVSLLSITVSGCQQLLVLQRSLCAALPGPEPESFICDFGSSGEVGGAQFIFMTHDMTSNLDLISI